MQIQRQIIYGAFKGMGDFICAAPSIQNELDAGSLVTVLIFPQVAPLVELLDFGSGRKNLQVCHLPALTSLSSLCRFLSSMSALSPVQIFLSPHAPLTVASWKIPMLLWLVKFCCWPRSRLVGAVSEPLSLLFNVRIPVDRDLPYAVREWEAYVGYRYSGTPIYKPRVAFKESVSGARLLPSKYDIVIHPGAGTDNRKWPSTHFSELVGAIPAKYRIAVVGVAKDVDSLRRELPADRSIGFYSGSLEDAIISIARSKVALTMDSGSMFFANVLGVPTVALFGPSDPDNVIPSDKNIVRVYEKKWSCQPCRRPRCSQARVFCMASITPRQVASELLGLLLRQG